MRRRRYSARLSVVCTGAGAHDRRRIASVLLDPIVEGVVHVGIVVELVGADVVCEDCGRRMDDGPKELEAKLDAVVGEGRITGQHDLSRSGPDGQMACRT